MVGRFGLMVGGLGFVVLVLAGARRFWGPSRQQHFNFLTNFFSFAVHTHRAQKNLTKKEQVELDNSIGSVFGFSPINPTGRYRLDLNDFYQGLVAKRCLQLSNNEGKKCRRSGGGDTSQHGNYMGFRNETLGGRPLQVSHDHIFPPHRTLSFDFVSSKRAPFGTKPVGRGAFDKMCKDIGLKDKGSGGGGGGVTNLKNLLAAKGAANAWKKKTKTKKQTNMVSPQALMAQRAKEKVEESESSATTLRGLVYTSDGRILRRGLGLSEAEGILMHLRESIVQNKFYFSIGQTLTLLDRLPPPSETSSHGTKKVYQLRVDCIIAMFARIVDGSDFTYRILRTLSQVEQDELVYRIGWLKLFDPYHPEGLYKLSLNRADDRRMALLLLHVCAHEEAFFWKDTTLNAVPLASIPSKWSRGMPSSGRLILTIDKDPNVESEYESDSDYSDASEEGRSIQLAPRKEQESAAQAKPDNKVSVDFFAKSDAKKAVTGPTGAMASKAGTSAADTTEKPTEPEKTAAQQDNNDTSLKTSVTAFGGSPANSTGRVTSSGSIAASTVLLSKSSSKPKRSSTKPKVDKSRRRRRLTAMTKQHVMPSTLHGSLVIQDAWEKKKAKKKLEKLNDTSKPISYTQQDSSSDEYSSSSDEEFGSLLNIERDSSSGEEDIIQGFQPEDTVFAGRVDECDSESFYDDKVLTEMLEMDWDRCVQDQPKVKLFFIKQHKQGLLADALPDVQNELLNEILDTFRKYKTHLYNTFDFYAVMGNGSDAGQIQMNQYSDWCDDCHITEPNNVPQCNRSALDRLFIVTNREDGQQDDTQDANDDRALMRFEFIEVIVRIAIAKFIQLKKTDSLPSAIKRLLQDYIKTNRGEGSCNALIDDPTVFRQKYVYTQETDQVLRKHVTMLNQMFRGYCKHSSKGMLLKEWIAMLKDIDLFNYDFTSREGKLAYVWSKSRVIDEVKGREKIHRMNFYDFVEGLLRIAQLKALPAPEDIMKLYFTKEIKEESLHAWINVARNPKKAKKILSKINRRSSDWGAKQTRPLSVKLQVLIDVVRISCDEDEGHTEIFQISKGSRMNSPAKGGR